MAGSRAAPHAGPARRRGGAASRGLLVLAVVLLAGCSWPKPPARPAATVSPADSAPTGWQAPWPHGGDVAALGRWWQQFGDATLDGLIAQAQVQSAGVAAAAARIAQAQAARTAAGAALGPQVGASVAATRGRQDLTLPVGTSLSGSLQAAWEIDLFGGKAAARDAAEARLGGARAGWHDARVAVAAEVASSYVALRACEAQVVQSERDARSRAETARLAELSARAGLQAPADAALSRGSAAQARAGLAAQQAACEGEVKVLAALTALPEPELRARLAAGRARVPVPTSPGLGAEARVPARALAQRPDLRAAEQELVAASADVGEAGARLLPSVTLNGSLGASRLSGGGITVSGSTWAIGPLRVDVPLFDGGARRANVAAARARYDEASAAYRGRLRTAVREVEQALVRLQATTDQAPDAQVAVDGFEAAFRAAEARYRGGLASLFELEDARRNAVQAAASLVSLQRERSAAWVALYRALGGGWDPADLPADLQAAAPAGGR